MFFVQGGKLSITDYGTDGKSMNNAHEVEIPAGAPPIFPAGAHQVKNVGDTTVKVVFIEPYVTCQPCGDIEGYVSPFEVAPQCYKVLAEDDNWITGLMTMEVGATDPVHHHKDHLIYVLEGDEVTIYPNGDEGAAMSVPIKAGAGIPAPMDAPPFFKHSLKNSGTVPIKMLFFEAKTPKPATFVPPPAATSASLGPFNFASGLPDCCTANPEAYSVLAELTNFRLVEMKVPAGGADKPHDHPSHSMYFLKPAKLEITDYDADGKSKNNPHVAEVPAGACPIFPAGAHQVKNVGDDEAQVLFIEAFPTCQPCGDVPEMISPFKVAPQCYKILAENDNFYTGLMTMEPGEEDPVHHHKDHLIYVLEGGEVTISGFGGDPMVVPMSAGAAIPAPMSAPPFAKHTLKNTGSTTLRLLFFEMKL